MVDSASGSASKSCPIGAGAGGTDGAASGGGHFQLTIVSEAFQGKASVARHRMIYDALGDLMHKEIHALQIEAFTPDQI